MDIKQKNSKIYFNDDNKSFTNITINKKTNSAFIELIKVLPKYRNNKLATKLLRKVIEYLKVLGYKLISLNPLPIERDGLNLNQLIVFYRNFNFVSSSRYNRTYPYLMNKKI